MSISNGRDTLSRVAFESSSGAYYKFAINPSSIVEQIPARNTFLQTALTVHMQGFGQGLHTIKISGTTGNNNGRGFDNLMQLRSMIQSHIQTAHDTSSAGASGNVRLTFHNFTDNYSYLVELNQDGITIEQSNDKPLLFDYTISMVVVGDANTPNTSEITWIQLGNIAPSITSRAMPTGYQYQYGKTELQDIDFEGLQTAVNEFEASTHSQIQDYVHTEQKQLPNLTPQQIKALYKTVYGSVLPRFDWDSYIESAELFEKHNQGSINNYGQSDSGAVVKILPPYDVNRIYQKLYGETLNKIDYNSYAKMSKLFEQMEKGTILDYGDPNEANTSEYTLSISDANAMYTIIYGKTVTDVDFNSYSNTSKMLTDDKYLGIINYAKALNDRNLSIYSSWNNPIGNQLVNLDDGKTNPWEEVVTTPLVADNANVKRYVNPVVSRDAPAYTYATINNILRV